MAVTPLRPLTAAVLLLGAALLLPSCTRGEDDAATRPTPSIITSHEPTPLAANGRLHVCGLNLCNEHGRAIQLRGMSTHGIHWFSQCYNDNSLDVLAGEWKADLLRIAMFVQHDGYEKDPDGLTEQVIDLVDLAGQRGMYAIVDFHVYEPGDPRYNTERAKTFFGEVAPRFAGRKNVIYEIANEPNGVRWPAVAEYARQVIPVIRAADPDAVILVGTPAWSSMSRSDEVDPAEVYDHPLSFQNVMYTFHFYAASHDDSYRSVLEDAAGRLPMFVSEFGTVEHTGDGVFDQVSATGWLDLLDRLKLSYANWTFSDADESSAAFVPGTCTSGRYSFPQQLTPSGAFIKARISTPDDF